MLVSLGFGTQFSTTETVVTILQDEFPDLRGKNRRWLLLGVCGFMYFAGLLMITEGGIYVLQLIDNHSATYSALILGCMEISVMAWCYGVDRYLEDIKHMLGFYPWPRIFWKWAWKIVSPSIVVCILVLTAANYEGNSYGTYKFPTWANAIGWMITFSSVMFIPIVAFFKIAQEKGSLMTRITKLTQPRFDWGPASPCHRRLPGQDAYLARTCNVDGSNMTLVTVGSVPNTTTLIQEGMEGACQLEPLNEEYEGEEDGVENSDDDGLQMMKKGTGQNVKRTLSKNSNKSNKL